ncbi:unnamed protein product [Diabrotica balteata]|uniref:Uncharacterized protein n=1 Tax=Diabrotica balteata TaxID=107213 RepID=A0A9N9T1F6_DIABA|nr:unnamed protein product [Diabrotica balteata]
MVNTRSTEFDKEMDTSGPPAWFLKIKKDKEKRRQEEKAENEKRWQEEKAENDNRRQKEKEEKERRKKIEIQKESKQFYT